MKLSSDTVLFEQRVGMRQSVIACTEMVSQEAYPSHNLVIALKMRNALTILSFSLQKMSLQACKFPLSAALVALCRR